MKMNFRIALSCLFLSVTASTTAFSQDEDDCYWAYREGYEEGYDDAEYDCPCPPSRISLTSGLYGGIGVGYEGFQIKRSPMVWDESIGSFNTHANGWNGRIFAGWGYFYRMFYLGGELFANSSSASGTDSINYLGADYYGRFSAGSSVGASLIPGFRLNESGPLFYGRLGVVKTDFKVYDQSGTWISKDTNSTSGFNVGLGVEFPLGGIRVLRGKLEYDYIKYSSFYNNGWASSRSAPVDNRGSFDIVYRIPQF